MTLHSLTRSLRKTYWNARYVIPYIQQPVPKNCCDDTEYASFLNGRRIVLVGPAPNFHAPGRGDLIESFDLVVRINHALPIPEELKPDLGERTDILYHNLWKGNKRALPATELVPILLQSVRWVCAAYPYFNMDHPHAKDIDAFLEVLEGGLPFRTVSPRPHIRLHWKMWTRPNAGISAVGDLLRFDVSELYLTGFTFYQSDKIYHEGYRGSGGSPSDHNQTPQMKQVREWIRTDSRIRADETIQRILFP